MSRYGFFEAGKGREIGQVPILQPSPRMISAHLRATSEERQAINKNIFQNCFYTILDGEKRILVLMTRNPPPPDQYSELKFHHVLSAVASCVGDSYLLNEQGKPKVGANIYLEIEGERFRIQASRTPEQVVIYKGRKAKKYTDFYINEMMPYINNLLYTPLRNISEFLSTVKNKDLLELAVLTHVAEQYRRESSGPIGKNDFAKSSSYSKRSGGDGSGTLSRSPEWGKCSEVIQVNFRRIMVEIVHIKVFVKTYHSLRI